MRMKDIPQHTERGIRNFIINKRKEKWQKCIYFDSKILSPIP